MIKHTPGFMMAVGSWVENVRDDKPDLVTSDGVGGDDWKQVDANARRIAACWNAFAGVRIEVIETIKVKDLL